MITLYHGSNCSVISPNPLLGRQGTDFGQGFYLTPDLDSARSMAAIVVDRKGEGAKTVNVYEFDEEALVGAGLRIRRFPMMDLDWVSFVIANRNFEREAPDHNLDRLYDVVVGLVADDKIRALIRSYRLGLTTPEQILGVLTSKKWRVTQYSFHTLRAMNFLRLTEVWHE